MCRISARNEQLVQVLCARFAEEVICAQVGIRWASPYQLGLLVENFSSFLLFLFAVLALWGPSRRLGGSFGSSFPAKITAAPLVGGSTGFFKTRPRHLHTAWILWLHIFASSAFAGSMNSHALVLAHVDYAAATVPFVAGHPRSTSRSRHLKIGVGQMPTA